MEPRLLERHDRDEPRDDESKCHACRDATGGIHGRQRPSKHVLAERVRRRSGSELHDRASDQRTDEPGNAQPGRVPAVLQQHRGEPRPDNRSDGEARQAQKRRHEAALRAPEGRQRHPREHEDVDGAHR